MKGYFQRIPKLFEKPSVSVSCLFYFPAAEGPIDYIPQHWRRDLHRGHTGAGGLSRPYPALWHIGRIKH